MSSGPALGIDLGGSKIYAVVTNEEHQVLASAKVATVLTDRPEQTVDDMYAAAAEALEKAQLKVSDIRFFGAAAPSPVNPATGDCLFAVNLAWKQASLKRLLEKRFGAGFVLENDGNLGQLAEHVCGAAKGFRSSIGYFVGTGLGGGIILDNRLLVGKNGTAAELGHVTVKADGRPCGCGHRGCIEAYCSKKAFVRALHKEMINSSGKLKLSIPEDKFNADSRNIKSKYLAKAYAGGDPVVCEIVNKGMYMLGIAAASACSMVGTECVVLGGGVMAAMGEMLLPVFRESFREHLFEFAGEEIPVRLSVLGDDAVAVGATILARGGVRFL